jgi:hypothetical protein
MVVTIFPLAPTVFVAAISGYIGFAGEGVIAGVALFTCGWFAADVVKILLFGENPIFGGK